VADPEFHNGGTVEREGSRITFYVYAKIGQANGGAGPHGSATAAISILAGISQIY